MGGSNLPPTGDALQFVLTFALQVVIIRSPLMPDWCNAMETTLKTQRKTLNLRVRAEDRLLIDNAAKARGKNVTDFVLDSVREAAESALLDKTFIQADPEAYQRFLDRLDAAPNPNPNLVKTMQEPAPWSK